MTLPQNIIAYPSFFLPEPWWGTNCPWTTSVHQAIVFIHRLFSLLPIMSYLSWESPQPPVCKEGLWVAAAGAVRLICCPNNCPLSPLHCVCVLYILCPNSFSLLTCKSVQSEAAGGEYLHKYWTKTGRNSRTATGLILDKYFTRPTNTPGGGGGGVWGVWRMRRILENTQRGEGGVGWNWVAERPYWPFKVYILR